MYHAVPPGGYLSDEELADIWKRRHMSHISGFNDESKGKLVNCLLCPRDVPADKEGPMFYQREDGTIVANLEGYVIVPREEYEMLVQGERPGEEEGEGG